MNINKIFSKQKYFNYRRYWNFWNSDDEISYLYKAKSIFIYSRDEMKQWHMKEL